MILLSQICLWLATADPKSAIAWFVDGFVYAKTRPDSGTSPVLVRSSNTGLSAFGSRSAFPAECSKAAPQIDQAALRSFPAPNRRVSAAWPLS